MTCQGNPIERIEYDLQNVETEMDAILNIKDAVDIVLCDDPYELARSRFESVFEAVQVIANADLETKLNHCIMDRLTMENVGNQLDGLLEALEEERQSFIGARNELFLLNREHTIKWLEEQVEIAEAVAADVRLAEPARDGAKSRLDAYRVTLEQLTNIRPKKED